MLDDTLVMVQGGSYEMGKPIDALVDEIFPKMIVHDFLISKYLVTFEEYDAYCELTGRDKPDDSGWGRGKRPVINLFMLDLLQYCNWLSEQHGFKKMYIIEEHTLTLEDVDYSRVKMRFDSSGNGFRLPTEIEWEFAARGGIHSKGYIHAGGNIATEVGWVPENAEGKAHPIGQKIPNELGLYDMTGNVMEVCCSNQEAQLLLFNQRGGCWSKYYEKYLPVYARHPSIKGTGDAGLANTTGFRICIA